MSLLSNVYKHKVTIQETRVLTFLFLQLLYENYEIVEIVILWSQDEFWVYAFKMNLVQLLQIFSNFLRFWYKKVHIFLITPGEFYS